MNVNHSKPVASPHRERSRRGRERRHRLGGTARNLKWDNIALITAAVALIYVVKRGPYGLLQPTVYCPPASEAYNLCVIAMCSIAVIGM